MTNKKKNNFFSWLKVDLRNKKKDKSSEPKQVPSKPISSHTKTAFPSNPKRPQLVSSLSPQNNSETTSITMLDNKNLPYEIKSTIIHIKKEECTMQKGFCAQLKHNLLKTRQNLGSKFINLLRGKKIDDEIFEKLEETLLMADVGVETTHKIINRLITHADRHQLKNAETLYDKLCNEMAEILFTVERPLTVEGKTPFIILMVGVNGVGKTTTIGKLARQYQNKGKKVMLAAGDTFRAAAIEQLKIWGDRSQIPVGTSHIGCDSAAVIFDAIQEAKARKIDVLIVDTAGRLQNKIHLMHELKKIVRIMKKLDVTAPHEIMLTIDVNTGQNAIIQTRLFNDTIGLTGIILTKLDGSAKGGVIFSIAERFGIPIRYIGVGENIEDLRPFNATNFIEALFSQKN